MRRFEGMVFIASMGEHERTRSAAMSSTRDGRGGSGWRGSRISERDREVHPVAFGL